MIKSKNFKIPLYGNRFTLIVYEQSSELKEHLKGYDFEKHNVDEYDGCVFVHDDCQYITLKRFIKDGAQFPTPGIIAHEAKHLVNNFFIDIGIKLDCWNDENECYMLMWIVNRIHEFLMNEFPKESSTNNHVDKLTKIRDYVDVQRNFGWNMGKTVNFENSEQIIDDIIDILNEK